MSRYRPLHAGLLACWVTAGAQSTAELETVEVVGQTPLGGRMAADRIANNTQVVTSEAIREQHALGLADFMQRNLGGVFVNEAQSNPLQPDVQYRGFVGSPLLGLPQGIAVYQDGVRVNEPFGDTVNWALIPDSAIDTVYLMPGSNPLFGLNALGGAIAIQTKDGVSHAGTRAEMMTGSFGRLELQADTGGAINERFSYFVTGEYLEEDGWRDFSPTQASQVFGKLSWQLERTSLDANITLVDTDLIGNGAAPAQLLQINRNAVFTRPDITKNEFGLFNLVFDRSISDVLSVTGNAYTRSSDISTYNGDDSDFDECASQPGFLCEHDDDMESVLLDADGTPIEAEDSSEGATINRTNTRQNSAGFGIQTNLSAPLGGRENFLIVGLSRDESDIDFAGNTGLGALDATRLAIPSGILIGSSFIRMNAETSNTGLYLSDSVLLTDGLTLTVSGRYNRTHVQLFDRLGTALNGNHEFQRFNPAIGMALRLGDGVTFYAGANESNRAPSPVELTCADENDPCRLPNAFLADPPLEQVVSRTLEAGLRGSWRNAQWHAGIFRTDNEDDILFISAGALTNEGYFDNVGKTRRDGVELSLNADSGAARWFANYTYLNASFRQPMTVPSPNNPAAVDGEIFVARGSRLPLVPSGLFKAGLSLDVTSKVTVGGEVLAASGHYFRGDEGNVAAQVDGHALLNLRLAYQFTARARLFFNIDNVLDRDYETFGLFGEADEVLGDAFDDTRFLSPGAPRAAWLGVSFEY
jgi:outer membrane receptor protein involved in Fe transport